MYFTRHTITITTDGSGDSTDYTTNVVNGRVMSITYTNTDLSTPDFTITTESTGQNLWVELAVAGSKTVSPRQATHDTTGTASLYASGGEAVEDYVIAVNERIKVVTAGGGATKTGTLSIVVG